MTLRGSFAPLAFLATCLFSPALAQETRIRFSGFGDFMGGLNKGKYVNQNARNLFEKHGTDAYPVNLANGFGITGTDFVVIADMTDKLTFLGEINFQAGRGRSNELGPDIERLFVDYKVHSKVSLQGGLFFTPIGYNNRFLYARAWLMNSIQVPDFFEEELGLVPTHTIGVAGHGSVPLRDGHRLNYIVSVGNSRSSTPEMAVYARDPQRSKMTTGLVEWIMPGFKDSRVGVSGWHGNISSVNLPNLGDEANAADPDRIKLREAGLDVFLVLERRWWSLNSEYVHSFQKDRLNNLGGQTFSFRGGLAELAGHFMQRRVHPYVRYDQTALPRNGGGPYLSLRNTDGLIRHHYIPNFKGVMTGSAYDVNAHFRVKAEVIRHFEGPRQQWGFAVQGAFGF